MGHQLVLHLYQTTKKAPRELRYTLVQKLLSEAVEALVDIDSANRIYEAAERLGHLRSLQRRMLRIGVLMTAAFEQRCLGHGAMAVCIATLDDMEHQALKWAIQTENRVDSTGAVKAEHLSDVR